MSDQVPTKRINVSITGEEAEMLERLHSELNKKLMMQLSMPQVVKHLIRQAVVKELA